MNFLKHTILVFMIQAAWLLPVEAAPPPPCVKSFASTSHILSEDHFLPHTVHKKQQKN